MGVEPEPEGRRHGRDDRGAGAQPVEPRPGLLGAGGRADDRRARDEPCDRLVQRRPAVPGRHRPPDGADAAQRAGRRQRRRAGRGALPVHPARSTLTLAPGTAEVDRNNAHETQRRPPLPLELSGVTVTVSGTAAGLYFVAPNQINFVVPPGLVASATPAPVAIFNKGTVVDTGTLIRTSLVLNAAQPDIFTSTNGPGGRAAALNVTNPCVAPPGEPFPVTTTRPAGSGTTGDCTSAQTETVATQVMFLVTGVRGVTAPANVTVRIGTTDIVGTADPNTSPVKIGPSNTPGFDQITVTLPASLAGAGDVPVIITVTAGGVTSTSRPADTAPRITIQ
ncbi:MAG: hypothetical protein LC795_04360 [Acidobacteria bacterium]|nr:hypothetical protein [Acidobacteriota bacterium]